jgi:hypothetical protein
MVSTIVENLLRTPAGLQIMVYISLGLLMISIGLGVTVEIQGSRLDAAKAKNETQAVQLQALGNQIVGQNAAVDQMLANAAKQAERIHSAEAAAGRIQVVTQERIQNVQLAAIPTSCPEAVIWGATHAIEIGKRWEAAP